MHPAQQSAAFAATTPAGAGNGASHGRPSSMPIYVINLARDAERLRTVSANLLRAGLAFERVDAFDGPTLLPRLRRRFRRDFFSSRLHRTMTPGEIGCILSHLRALRRVLAQRLPYAIILEDDVAFANEFASFVRDELPDLLRQAQVIKLEGIRDRRSSRTGVRLATTRAGDLFVPLRPALGSAGYAVSRSGAQHLMKAFKRLDRPADHLLGAYDLHRAVYAELTRFPVYQTGECSNIRPERQVAIILRPSWRSRLGALARQLTTAIRRLARIAAMLATRLIGGRSLLTLGVRRPAGD